MLKTNGCNLIRKSGIVILQTLLLFAPEFIIFPKYTWVLALLGVWMLLTTQIKGCVINGKTLWSLVFLMFVNIGLSLLSILANQTSDYSYIVFLIGTLLTVFRCILLVFVICKTREKEEDILVRYIEVYVDACVIYVLFTLVFITFPEFKRFWLNEIIHSQKLEYFVYEFRYSLNGFAAFSASTIFSIVLMMNAYLIVHFRKCKRKLRKHFATYLICVIGCFFYGRVTIVAMVLSMVYILRFLLGKKQLYKIVKWSVVSICILWGVISILAKSSQSFFYWKQWAFAIIRKLFSMEKITDYSVTHMFQDMYYMPDVKTLFIGDGQYTTSTGGYYGATDVGFMRTILFFGIGGCLINYAMFFLYWYKCRHLFLRRTAERTLIVFLGILLIVLEMKGEAYHQFLAALIPIFYLGRYKIGLISKKVEMKEDEIECQRYL